MKVGLKVGMVAACLAGLMLGTASRAADESKLPLAPLWEVGVGLFALNLPHYRGSDQSRAWLLPVPYGVYRGDILRADREGARAVLLDSGRFDVDLSVAASAPTRSSANIARAGMPDLAPTIEVGPKLNLRLGEAGHWRWDLRVPVRAVITLQKSPRDTGWSATPMLVMDGRIGGWDVGAQAGLLWGSRRLHASIYDVSAAQATASRPAYRSEAGYAGWQTTAGLSRRFNNLWLGAFVRYDSVQNAVFDNSPLVRRNHNVYYGVGLSWIFSQSDQQVPDRDARP
jgi:MipA family protein